MPHGHCMAVTCRSSKQCPCVPQLCNKVHYPGTHPVPGAFKRVNCQGSPALSSTSSTKVVPRLLPLPPLPYPEPAPSSPPCRLPHAKRRTASSSSCAAPTTASPWWLSTLAGVFLTTPPSPSTQTAADCLQCHPPFLGIVRVVQHARRDGRLGKRLVWEAKTTVVHFSKNPAVSTILQGTYSIYVSTSYSPPC